MFILYFNISLLYLFLLVVYYCSEFAHLFINIDLVIWSVCLFSISVLKGIFSAWLISLYFNDNYKFLKKYFNIYFFFKNLLNDIAWFLFEKALFYVCLVMYYYHLIPLKAFVVVATPIKDELIYAFYYFKNSLLWILLFKFEVFMIQVVLELFLRFYELIW
jgi:hypothetical protein